MLQSIKTSENLAQHVTIIYGVVSVFTARQHSLLC